MMRPRGFTLTEMLVVLAIVGTLAGIGYPLVRSFIGKSRQAACLNNLRALGTGLESYLQDHGQRLPTLAAARALKTEDVPVLETVLLPYLDSPDAFKCPEDSAIFTKSGSSYAWFTPVNGQLVSQLAVFAIKDRPDQIPLIHDKEGWHPGGPNLLYADSTSSNKVRFATGN